MAIAAGAEGERSRIERERRRRRCSREKEEEEEEEEEGRSEEVLLDSRRSAWAAVAGRSKRSLDRSAAVEQDMLEGG